MQMSQCVQDQLANVKLLAKENDRNELSKRLADLGLMSRQVEVGEESSKQSCQLGEANNQNI